MTRRAIIALFFLPVMLAGTLDFHESPRATPGSVFVVAHNAGNDPTSISSALVRESDVVEIDVSLREGRLVALHPVTFLEVLRPAGGDSLQPVSLESAWEAARSAGAIQLDLKSNSIDALRLLVDFLDQHQRETELIVTSRAPYPLRAVRAHIPEVCRYLSLSTLQSVEALLNDAELLGAIDGVAIREELLDVELVRVLNDAELRVLAWTVNDPERADELVEWGVDGITTDQSSIAIELDEASTGSPRLCDRD